MRPAPALLAGLLVASPLPAGEGRAAQRAEAIYAAAMPAYYAALLASARGDAEGTTRHVILLESRWTDLARLSDADVPPWLRESLDGRPVVAAVAATLGSARRHLPKDVAAAHAELETVRLLLRDARARHAVASADDAVTDYHEALERLASHTGAANEITLTAEDFSVIRDDVARARSTWRDLRAARDAAAAGWSDIDGATIGALRTVAEAVDRQDGGATQQAARALKTRYFDLLAWLSRRR